MNVTDCVVVDTNVVSYILKGGELGVTYSNHIRDKIVAISFMTVAEMLYGAEVANWGATRRERLEDALLNFLILPYDYETCRCWADVTAARQRIGRVISCADAWIAASALRYGLPVVTHNPRDFQETPNLSIITSEHTG